MSEEESVTDEEMVGTYWVDFMVSVKVTVNNGNVIARCVNNEDGWRDSLYDLRDRDDVLSHLARNAVVNHETGANRLDGWADLPPDAVVMEVDHSSLILERVEREES